ncbi:hypothetical protein C8Q77DRAFT_1219156 [Trametes polyzona]|nr:hypothetical protein C8Q77DRAFT_1219156 [Trametes polyzona]
MALPSGFAHETAFDEYNEQDTSLRTHPLLGDDLDIPDAPERHKGKAARILGVSLADLDYDMSEGHRIPGGLSDASGSDGRRASLSQLNLSTLSLRESARGLPYDVPMEDDEDTPLLGGTSGKSGRLGKARRSLGKRLFRPFSLVKSARTKVEGKRALTEPQAACASSDAPAEGASGEQDEMEWEDEDDAGALTSAQAEGSAGQGDGAEQGKEEDTVEVEAEGEVEDGSPHAPKTPRRKRPTTPRRSPKSAGSRRSVSSWYRTTPRTPCSARSWRSDSSPGSSPGSTSAGSVLLNRTRRRRKRDDALASQTKCVQLLGPESCAAVARATNVKETKLRYRTFGRELHEQLKRAL